MSPRHTSIPLIVALSFASNAFAADTMFKKVEADGSVTFTDQPLEDAEVTVGAPISVIGPSPSSSQAIPAPPPVGVDERADSAGETAQDRPAPASSRPTAWRPNAPIAPLSVAPVPGDATAAAVPESDSISASRNGARDGAASYPAPYDAAVPGSEAASEPATAAAMPPLVTAISIISPHDGAMLVDRGEPATLRLDATLTDTVFGDALRTDVLIDGEIVASGPLDSVAFPMPESGAHVLAARVTDAGGRVLATSASRTVHVKTARAQ